MKETKFSIKIIGILFDPMQKKVLVGKNKGDKYFSFVDGELKYDEELDDGLKRVTKEKTGYIVHNLGAVYANNRVGGSNNDILELYFLCEIREKKEEKGDKVEEIRWIKAKEFEKLADRRLPSRLKEYLNNICG